MIRQLPLLLFLFTTTFVHSQDLLFSQYYMHGSWLNPALTANANNYSAVVSARQGYIFGEKRSAFAASFEKNLECQNSGIGVYFQNDELSNNALSNLHTGINYAYKVKIKHHPKRKNNWNLSLGLKTAYGQRKLAEGDYIYPDQLDGDLGQESFSNIRKSYFDLHFGGLLYSENLWIGGSIAHLNDPNIGMVVEEILSPRFNIHLGTQWTSKRNDFKILPAIIYDYQFPTRKILSSIHFTTKNITFGTNLTLINKIKYKSSKTFTALFGVKHKDFFINYSYEHIFNLEGMNSTHELSIKLQPRFRKKKSKCGHKQIICPI